MARKTISVIVPVHNEEAVLPTLFRRLTDVLDRLAPTYDGNVFLIDDGSRDRSWELITAQARHDPRYRGIRLSRNFGHQAAISCGYELVPGDALVTIDADLQDPPEVILDLVRSWEAGHKVVLAARRKREGETWFKLLTARLFYQLLHRIAESDAPEGVGDFRLLDRQAVDALRQFPETHRYVRGLVGWLGFHRGIVEYDREPRAAGETKYPLWKMLRLAADAIISLSFVPLRVAYVLAILCTIPFLGYLAYNLILQFYFHEPMVRGWPSLILATIIFGSVNLLMFGILGEYVGRIYAEVKHRPLFIIDEVAGQAPPLSPPFPAQAAGVRSHSEAPQNHLSSPP
ncbi:MAG: Glycosyltransferase [Candidatus Ozemobacter sibiricus]|jgi:dolichol-phosphate mannosyltransferase|uniref:Glycosyltransferase n=1 Tax=Candidatus Ozemobacter sibiricus TaxID=2268124 RepID=A0A367ZTT1_9BACT|nr:MAG: Glycosyltransferase [Candidatus Ozemobacter sibiricus]